MNKLFDENVGLLLIDIQKDYFEKGRNPLKNANAALINTKEILDIFRNLKQPIIHIKHISTKVGATFFLPDTEGAEIHPIIAPKEGEDVIIKHKPNSFADTELKAILEQYKVKKLVVCGMMTHHCVDSTVRAANEYGFEVFLVDNSCATKNLKYDGEIVEAETVHKVFIAALQGFSKVVSTKDIINSTM